MNNELATKILQVLSPSYTPGQVLAEGRIFDEINQVYGRGTVTHEQFLHALDLLIQELYLQPRPPQQRGPCLPQISFPYRHTALLTEPTAYS